MGVRGATSSRRGLVRRIGGIAMVLAVVGAAVFAPTGAQAAPAAGFVMEPYATGFVVPVDLEWAPNGLLFVAEKDGRIKVVDNGTVSTFLDITAEVNSYSDRGLLGVAVHPDLTTGSPYVYALYTYDPPEAASGVGNAARDGGGQRVSRLTRFTAEAASGFTTVVPGSGVTILGGGGNWTTAGAPSQLDSADHPDWACGNRIFVRDCVPADSETHSIGTVTFGPDGMLYVGNGDSSRFGVATLRAFRTQDPDSLAGKILRLDPITGAGVSTNPFWDGDANSNRSKVFQLGVRNPYRFTVHSSGEVWIGDVGEVTWEEINHGGPGADFGWPCFEGGPSGTSLPETRFDSFADCSYYYADNSAVAPVHSYANAGGAAVMATDFYTGTAWPVEYHDALIVVDFEQATIKAMQVRGAAVTEVTLATAVVAVDATFGPDGDLYVAEIVTGTVSRIRLDAPPPNVAPTASAGADQTVQDTDGNGVQAVTLDGSASSDPDGVIVSHVWSVAGTTVAIGPNPTADFAVGSTTVLLTVTDDLGATGTDTVVVTVDPAPPPPPPGGNLSVDKAELSGNRIKVEGTGAIGGADITVDGQQLGSAENNGDFKLEARNFTSTSCTVEVSDGVDTVTVALDGC